MPGFLRNLLLVLLIVATTFSTGCVSTLTPAPGAGSGGTVTISDAPTGGGLVQTSSGGAKIAAYAFVGLAITFCFALDVLILAATRRHPFPCCRAVFTLCR